MNPIVSHLISGRVIFTGLGLMVLLVILSARGTSARLRCWLLLQVWLLAILALSTAALSAGVLALAGVMLAIWTGVNVTATAARIRPGADSILLAGVLGLLVWELSWTAAPRVPPVSERSLIVLGDSISAGLGEGEGTPWPQQLAAGHAMSVTNLSQAGATSQDGPRMAEAALQSPGLVIIELGGNDLLGGRSVIEFESDLAHTLKLLRDRQRTVLMVELPLLPGKNAWGVAQRRLAAEWGVLLIPKRHLVDVLATPGSTVDALHLSEQGHRQMAEMVRNIIQPALPSAREKPADPPAAPSPAAIPATVSEPQIIAKSATGKPRAPSLDEIVLFQPSRSGNWQPQGLVHQDVEFTAADGTQLHGWYCPADHPRAVMLYCHGNGGNIAGLAGLLEHLRRNSQLTVMAFDYRGYGKSQGLPTVEGVIADGEAARTQLAELSGVPVPRQLLWGHSLGGAVAVQLARQQNPRALILESTFDSFQSVARHHAPQWAFLVQPGKLDSIGCISEVTCPLFQLHGTADRVVPYAMGVNLFNAANDPKQFLTMPGVDHNDGLDASTFQTIDTFIDEHCTTSR